MRTIVDSIAGAGGGTGTLTVLAPGGPVEVTWAELHHRARRAASVLTGIGVSAGSRIGFLCDTSAGLVTALQAAWLAGAAVTILPPPGRSGRQAHLDTVQRIIADAGIDLLVADEPQDGLGRVICLSTLDHAALGATPAQIRPPDTAQLAVLQYTSGSTRAPRGVPVTHAHLAANIEAIRHAMRHEADHPTRWMSWLPLYHDLGLMGLLSVPMSCGCPLVLQSPLAFAMRPARWLEVLSHYRITTTGAPNFAYALMADALAAGAEADLSSVRFMLSGGEPIDAAVMHRFTAAAAPRGLDPGALVAAYGMAEATLAVSMSMPGEGLSFDAVDPDALERFGVATPAGTARRLARVGRPVRGTTVRVVDAKTGEALGERMVGRIEIRGPSVVPAYWGEPAAPPQSWLRTGDLGYLAEGELVVCGREKDVLFAAGRNIYPQDVEASASEVPGVRHGAVAAFGIPGRYGDRLVIALESRPGNARDVPGAVAVRVAGDVGMSPADVVVLRPGHLPKTTSGKLRRDETRRRYLAGELTAQHPERELA